MYGVPRFLKQIKEYLFINMVSVPVIVDFKMSFPYNVAEAKVQSIYIDNVIPSLFDLVFSANFHLKLKDLLGF